MRPRRRSHASGNRLIHVGGPGVPPRTSAVVGRAVGTIRVQAQGHQTALASERSLPLPPQDAAQPAPQPFIQAHEGDLHLAELEVGDPATDDRA